MSSHGDESAQVPSRRSLRQAAPRDREGGSVPEAGGPGDERRRLCWWPWLLGGLLAAIIGVAAATAAIGAVFVAQAVSVRDDLEQSKAIISRLGGELSAGQMDAVSASSEQLTALTANANETVQGRLWRIASGVPAVGANVDAVRRVTSAVDILAREALPSGIDLTSKLNLSKVDIAGGGIDLSPFRDAQAQISTLSAAFASAKSQIEPIDRSALLPAVSEPIQELLDTIDSSAPALDVVNRYLPTLLNLAGADGKKTYLIVFQNNAEIRATGGNPAASMIITVENGKIETMDQASSETFYAAGTAGSSFTALPAETLSLYPSTFPQFSQDFTMTPDFPTTAELFQNLWSATSGARFDGVISIDPVVLAQMLQVAGPFTLATGEQIDAGNAVKVLLSDAYERYPTGSESDAFFADAAQRAFLHLTQGGWNPVDMLTALETSAAQQRINLAFTDPAAQKLAAELGVEGGLREDNTEKTQIGIYLNDYSVGKLEYHLTTALQATCNASARTVTVTMTMTNSIPDSIKSGYTLGYRNAKYGLPPRTMMLDVLYFAPPGASITSIDPGAGDVTSLSRSGTEKGNTAQSQLITVAQGQTRAVSYTVQLPDGALGPMELRHSPTAGTTTVTVDPGCDALFGAH